MLDDSEPGIVLWLSDTAICRMLQHDTEPRYEVRIATRDNGVEIQFFSDTEGASQYAVDQMRSHGSR
jgi:hypothetical protein